MNTPLIYVVGPSGAGKDSVLDWLRTHLPAKLPIAWAQRTIDRPCTPEGELHESVETTQFQHLLATQAFAMHWTANGHHYGIRHAQLDGLSQGHWIFVNGSRAYIPQAAAHCPGLTVLHITADVQVLEHRLWARGRESLQAIQDRLHRTPPLQLPPGCNLIEVQNNGSLESSGQQLLVALRTLKNWPAF